MQFPLSFNDISLWLAISALILLATSELINPLGGQTDITIDKGRLKTASLIIGFLFLFTVAIRIFQIFITL